VARPIHENQPSRGASVKKSKSQSAVRLILDGLVVIVSILIAFGLDAWWSAHQLRLDLIDDLNSVGEEFEANVASLEVELRLQRIAAASIHDLVDRIDGAGEDLWLTLPDTIVSFAFVYPPTYEASTGAVVALISSGALSRIRDSRLKGILGNIEAQVQDVRETELGARHVAAEVIMPLFWEEAALASALGRGREFRGRGLAKTQLTSRPIRIRNAAGLKNRLLLRLGWVDGSVGSLDDLRTDMVLALDLLQVEVSGM
jgi:hypothetical protein